jgi:DNA-binding CsgD family transcriptional regulator
VSEIAAGSGVSPNTTKAHVRGVLQKTGCSRQVDVIALLGGIASARLPGPA